MDVEYADDDLRMLAVDPNMTMGLPRQVVQKYRDRIAVIKSVSDERPLYALGGSLDYKKLKGCDEGIKQMRLNKKYRIRVQPIRGDQGQTIIRILGIGDFHND